MTHDAWRGKRRGTEGDLESSQGRARRRRRAAPIPRVSADARGNRSFHAPGPARDADSVFDEPVEGAAAWFSGPGHFQRGDLMMRSASGTLYALSAVFDTNC